MSVPDRDDGAHHVLFRGIDELCRTAVRLTGVDGAAIAVFGSAGDARDLVFATDVTAAHLDDLQFTLGEGPCIDAFTTQEPVLVGALADDSVTDHWPVFRSEVRAMDIGAVFAVPVSADDFTVGVLELYRRRPGDLQRDERQAAQVCARLAAVTIRHNVDDVAEAGDSVEEYIEGADEHLGRDDVHVAAGMIAVQLGIATDAALDLLKGASFRLGRPISVLSGEIVTRTRTFREIESEYRP
ncbi:MAG: GAF domain-containing protein [Gordonia paraffinivorans]